MGGRGTQHACLHVWKKPVASICQGALFSLCLPQYAIKLRLYYTMETANYKEKNPHQKHTEFAGVFIHFLAAYQIVRRKIGEIIKKFRVS